MNLLDMKYRGRQTDKISGSEFRFFGINLLKLYRASFLPNPTIEHTVSAVSATIVDCDLQTAQRISHYIEISAC